MTRISIFVLLVVFSPALCCRERKDTVSPTSSQPNAHQHPPELNDALSRILGSPTISPQQLEAFTNQRDGYETDFVDFKPIWKRLDISSGQDGLFDGFDKSSTRWAAELIDVSSQLKPVKIVVKLSANGGADRRYLVFVKDEAESNVERWSFSGQIDITDNYEASAATRYHRVVSDSNHVWLVLRNAPRIGTGYRLVTRVGALSMNARPARC